MPRKSLKSKKAHPAAVPAGATPSDPPAGPNAEVAEVQSSSLDLLRRLQAGTLSPSALSAVERRSVVECLSAQGSSAPEMADLLKVNERTIFRDLAALHEARAVERDPRLAARMVGRLLAEAELSISRIRRACRDKTAPASVQVDGAHRCYLIMTDALHRLQSMGYLPSAAQKIEADLNHHLDDLPGLEQIQVEVQRLRGIAQSTPGSALAPGSAPGSTPTSGGAPGGASGGAAGGSVGSEPDGLKAVQPDCATATLEALSQIEQLAVRATLSSKVRHIASQLPDGGDS